MQVDRKGSRGGEMKQQQQDDLISCSVSSDELSDENVRKLERKRKQERERKQGEERLRKRRQRLLGRGRVGK